MPRLTIVTLLTQKLYFQIQRFVQKKNNLSLFEYNNVSHTPVAQKNGADFISGSLFLGLGVFVATKWLIVVFDFLQCNRFCSQLHVAVAVQCFAADEKKNLHCKTNSVIVVCKVRCVNCCQVVDCCIYFLQCTLLFVQLHVSVAVQFFCYRQKIIFHWKNFH